MLTFVCFCALLKIVTVNKHKNTFCLSLWWSLMKYAVIYNMATGKLREKQGWTYFFFIFTLLGIIVASFCCRCVLF